MKYLIIILFCLVACQSQESTENTKRQDSTKVLSTTDSLLMIQNQADRVPFAEWCKNAEHTVNQIKVKDSVIQVVGESSFINILPFHDQKDSLLLIDIHKDTLDAEFSNQKYLFKLENNHWKKIVYYQTIQSWIMPFQKGYWLLDINFDQQKDLVFYAHSGSASRILYYYQCFLKINNSYQFYKPDSQEDEPFFLFSTNKIAIDAVQKRIITFGDGGNFSTHSKTIQEWSNGNLTITKQLEMTVYENLVERSYGYHFQEFKRKNKELVLIKEWKTKGDDWEYFNNWEKTPTTQEFEF